MNVAYAQSSGSLPTETKGWAGKLDAKPAQNIQEVFLNTVRKDRALISIYLVSGVKLTGRIRSFDKYSVLLESNGMEQLIFKHAISTVTVGRSGLKKEHREATDSAISASSPIQNQAAMLVSV